MPVILSGGASVLEKVLNTGSSRAMRNITQIRKEPTLRTCPKCGAKFYRSKNERSRKLCINCTPKKKI